MILQGGEIVPDSQTYLKFYDKSSGVWREKAEAPTLADFKADTFSVAQLSSGVPGEAWFLAWGGSFSSSHAIIKVRLYGFEGGSVRTIWKEEDLAAGKVTTTADGVVIDYLDWENNFIEKHDVYYVTPNGLVLQ